MNYLQKKKLAFMSIVNSVKGFIRTIIGVFPLTLTNCVDAESITDYSIYGNSVQDGTPDTHIEVYSVGDRTTNLIDWDLLLSDTTITKVENGYYSKVYFHNFATSRAITKQIVSVLKPNVTYTLSRRCSVGYIQGTTTGNVIIYGNGGTQLVATGYGATFKSVTFTLTQEQIDSIKGMYIYFSKEGTDCTISEIQLTESDTVLPYEPYGKYKIPVTVSGNGDSVTTNIYLDEPLGQGQSISYKKDNLPTIPTFKGTSVLTVDTNIQPSNAEVTYYSTLKG